MSRFQPARALAFARSISRPRLCGTEGERAVRNEIVEALRGAGMEVVTEPVEFKPGADALARLSLAWAHAGLVFLGLGAWLDPRFAWAGLAWIALLALLRHRVLRALSAARCRSASGDVPPPGWIRTENIVARAAGPDDGPLLVFLAHHDSKSQSLSLGASIAFLRWSRTASFMFAGLALARAYGQDVPTWLVAAAAATALALSAPLYALRTGNASPGGLDNASGVGALVETARAWKALQGSSACRAVFLSPSAEEFGMVGSEVWVRAHRDVLRQEPRVWALNFDGVGLGGPVRVVPAGGPERDGLSMFRVLCEAAGRINLELHPVPASAGLATDHLSFTREGIPCATLLTHSWTARSIHTAADTGERLQAAGFENIGRIVEQVVLRLGAAPRG